MTPERRIWQIGTVFTLLLLLLSFRLLYWQLARAQTSLPDIPDEVAALEDVDPSETTMQEVATGTPTATVTPKPTVSPQGTVQPTRTPMPTSTGSVAPTETPSPSPTPTADIAAITRGTIYDRDGRRLAYDLKGKDGSLVRFYTEPSLAHVIGYISGLRTGVTGIEQAYDKVLLGLDHQAGLPVRGNDVHLTVDSRVQRAAAQALEGKAGAVVVMDAQSGAVLAMASSPSFDPNRILDPDYIRELESCDGSETCRQALFNRSTQGWYTPGSTWKTVTLIAALDTGQVTPKTVFDFGRPLRDRAGRIYYVYTVDGFSIIDPNHREQQLDLVRCYAISANAAFARIGDEMPPEVMIMYAARLGFSRPGDGVPPIEIDASAARLAIDPRALYTDNPLRASTAIGQGELLASPLNIALVTAAVVNDGNIPIPHLVQSVNGPSGKVLEGETVGHWITNTMRPQTAQQVRAMMIEVVRQGSGMRAQLPEVVVGVKTGTAQMGDDSPPHAWTTGFVRDDERTVVIAVMIENGGAGSRVAAPLFARVADVAIHHMGEPVEEIVSEPTPP